MAPAATAGYPGRWAADVVLRDGATVHLRPIHPGDAHAVRDLHGRLSAETIYYRFFGPLHTLGDAMLDRFVNVDYRDRFALVAVLGDDIIAVARWERLASGPGSGDDAEVAFLVDDAHQGRGLGTVLLEHLAAAASEAGIARFVADTLPDNSRMLRLFHEAGFGDERIFADGVVRVAFAIDPTTASVDAAHRRELEASGRSVARLLAPRSVAVVGAGRSPSNLGHQLLRSLLAGGFDGPVYPVNPAARHVRSVRAYARLSDIPDRVDLAVVAVPAGAVADVVEDCARAHVGGLVVISAGFAESGGAGAVAESTLVAEARRNGMRLIGPNCMGVVNTDPSVGLNATFSPMPPAGGIGMVAQSGGLGVVILDEMARRGLGVSTFASLGNKADVSGNDLLSFWDGDDRTRVIAMYIEAFGNPRTFARLARRVGRTKPVVVVKSRRSPAGGLAAGAHRASREDEEAVDALFRQAGVVRTDTLEELFDVAQVLDSQPLPAGGRVAIVGNAGGSAVLAADACAAAGLELARLSPASEERLRRGLGSRAAASNPVDLPPDARPPEFGAAIDAVLRDGAVDAVIALYTSPMAAPLDAVATAVAAAAEADPSKPVLVCALGRRGLIRAGDARIPGFAFPEAAARALGHVARYAAWRRRPAGRPVEVEARPQAAARAVAEALAGALGGGDGRADLGGSEAAEVLEAYGIVVAAGEAPPRQGVEVVVSATTDPVFGPLVALTRRDRQGHPSPRALPVTDFDAAELVEEALGDAAAGVDRHAREALVRLLGAVARLLDDVPAVVALQLPEVVAAGSHCWVGTAHLVLEAPRSHPERALRRLS